MNTKSNLRIHDLLGTIDETLIQLRFEIDEIEISKSLI